MKETAEAKPLPKRSLPTDPLEAIVSLQTFSGSWAWDDDLLAALGLDVKAKSLSGQLGAAFAAGTDIFATALVLAYLQTQLAGRKDEWEMMADKASDWLNDELSAKGHGISAQDYVSKVKAAI